MAADYVWYNGKYQQVGESTVVRQLKVQVVNSLPSEGTPGVLYIVPGGSGPSVDISWGDISGNISNQTDLQNALNSKVNTSDLPSLVSGGVSYITTAPTSTNTDGLKFVVLNEEPEIKYEGWIYIITEE